MNKRDENNDYILEASRCTLALVLATLLIWGIFDVFNAQNTGFGFPWWLIIEIVIVYTISRYYFTFKNSKK
ncbi:hypothetical protein B1B04_21600 [Lysinibacillus sp. KCTC 33748]|uniref:hypothetical protein n=1 Tax=unclassified Lysinibacillus TaxID=2636778 RepID=UPI0009A75661|nr:MULTISPECIES: hypothetical protein [unclassified Lysinibacillus]OXS68210.1 hypothetical protein B1B04_21600 [Lysinibacillus sp. KCTC 33748]